MIGVEKELRRQCPACGSIGEDPGDIWKEGRLGCPNDDCQVRIFLEAGSSNDTLEESDG